MSGPRRAEVVEVEVDGETVIYEPSGQTLHHLDPIATVIWQQLDGTLSTDELVEELAAAFGAPPEVVGRDVATLIETLQANGLLQVT